MTKPLLLRSKSHHKAKQKKTIFEKITVKQFLTALLTMVAVVLILLFIYNLKLTSSQFEVGKLSQNKNSLENTKSILSKLDYNIFLEDMNKILIPRVSGTPGNDMVKKHILARLEGMNVPTKTYVFTELIPVLGKDVGPMFGRPIERGPFRSGWSSDRVPIYINFTNVVGRIGPSSAKKTLVLACHHDSKYRLDDGEYYKQAALLRNNPDFEVPTEPLDADFKFLGATDSAVPCSMILLLAQWLNSLLRDHVLKWVNEDRALQVIFFDGEEAFDRWNEHDSLYGSRWMAQYMNTHQEPQPGHPDQADSPTSSNMLKQIELFVLLDLIGERGIKFRNLFSSSSHKFRQLAEIEKKLHKARLLSPSHTSPSMYFASRGLLKAGIEDDHIPFLRKNVNILHLISVPFPQTWHKFGDDGTNLDHDSIGDLLKILAVFVIQNLELEIA